MQRDVGDELAVWARTSQVDMSAARANRKVFACRLKGSEAASAAASAVATSRAQGLASFAAIGCS